VTIDTGPIIGRVRDSVESFFGIPYAAPPTGQLRFSAPAPVAPWSTPRVTDRHGMSCPQPGAEERLTVAEDCLYLNVWVPESAGAQLPVFVYLHGGAFVNGSGSEPRFDGARFAKRERAIVVTLNYRLGPLGFMSHPAQAREQGVPVAPSMGLLDQRAALRWTQRNIGAFGGDATRVTLFGESAGAWSLCAQLASPDSQGLFSRAIIQSGACSGALWTDPSTATAQAEALTAALGCKGSDELACLRAVTPEALLGALPLRRGMLLRPGAWWGPVIDGRSLPTLPMTALQSGAFVQVPLIIGWNRDEGLIHTLGFQTVSQEDVDGFVRDVSGERAPGPVHERYARADPKAALTDIVTDGVFACGARRIARAVSRRGVSVFLYEYTHVLDSPRARPLGATHSLELFFVFGNADLGIELSAAETPLSRTIMDAWGRHGATGSPASIETPWPAYTLEGDQHLVLDVEPRVGDHLKQAECDFWDTFEP
jgi:para-nitrobenzyl esterase